MKGFEPYTWQHPPLKSLTTAPSYLSKSWILKCSSLKVHAAKFATFDINTYTLTFFKWQLILIPFNFCILGNFKSKSVPKHIMISAYIAPTVCLRICFLFLFFLFYFLVISHFCVFSCTCIRSYYFHTSTLKCGYLFKDLKTQYTCRYLGRRSFRNKFCIVKWRNMHIVLCTLFEHCGAIDENGCK